jgi:mannose-1-phosphate guanylyltransferase
MILHQIEALAAVGVTDVVLAVNYRPEIMERVLKEVGTRDNPCNKPLAYR